MERLSEPLCFSERRATVWCRPWGDCAERFGVGFPSAARLELDAPADRTCPIPHAIAEDGDRQVHPDGRATVPPHGHLLVRPR